MYNDFQINRMSNHTLVDLEFRVPDIVYKSEFHCMRVLVFVSENGFDYFLDYLVFKTIFYDFYQISREYS